MELAALHREILERSTDGIWVHDLAGRTIYANPEIARLYGAPASEAVGLTVFDMLDETGRGQFAAHLEDVRAGRVPDGEVEVEVQLVRRDGTPTWVIVRESVLRGPDGRPTALLHRLSGYDERRRTLEELRSSRGRLAEAQRIARIGSWEWDVTADVVTLSPELLDLYGLASRSGVVDYAGFLDLVHAEDRSGVDRAVHDALAGAGELGFLARLRGRDGWVWTRGRGVVHRDSVGGVRMAGTHQDVSETQQAYEALEVQLGQNALLHSVATAANESGSLLDVLRQARTLLLRHDQWERGRAFRPADDEDGVVPLPLDPADVHEDGASDGQAAVERALAEEAARRREPCWDDAQRTIAFPVVLDEGVCAVVTITASARLRSLELVRPLVEQVAVQVARVAERERAQQQLADARDQAMAASRQKSEFLATMSHELRTPLNGVLGLTDLLMRTGLDPERLRLASGVQAASRALLGLINDVLDFAQLQAGTLELSLSDFDVRRLVDDVTGPLAESAGSKGLALTVTCGPGVPAALRGDVGRIGQVLANVVSNAVKFTDRGAVTVDVGASPVGADDVLLCVEIADTGVGIEPGLVEAMFQPFTQADTSSTRVFGGAGLGLGIAREITRALGGELAYAARPGGGSVFTISVPVSVASPPASVSAPADPGGARSRSRILVVEDNPVNQLVATGMLEAVGYAVRTAVDGVDALEILADEQYDAILMDVQMPRLDGYDTTRELRLREPAGVRVPVIAMTAAARDGERERCLAAGMDDFLTKPVDPAALVTVLGRWLDPPVSVPPTQEKSVTSSSPLDALDVERLEMLRDLDPGNTTYLDRAIGNFAANAEPAVALISEAIAARDAVALRAAAHKLAGSALNLGVPSAGEAARALESLGDAGTTEGAEELVAPLEDALRRGLEALRAFQQSYS
ncbi:PAS domain-containing hybrid sensor histidine kinase/response regulator [Nocardioides pantholopis]|uniref:PAS domain-containing hybrid sensor histidine kinase/response regulator n=1 Tax=Nocardioides pantholopis TaxID=2483798 RepID=UPI000FD92746|nr:response regulator [Nocardioides pantholopis]